MSAPPAEPSFRHPDGAHPRPRRPQPLAGTAVVFVLIAGTRWASYVGVAPFFLTDVLAGLAILNFYLSRVLGRRRAAPASEYPPATTLLLAIPVWAVARFALNPALTTAALRDVAPYAYSLLGVLAVATKMWSSSKNRRATYRLFMAALWFHATWYSIVQLRPELASHLPELGPGVGIFSVRADVDTALVGLLGAVLVARVLARPQRTTVLLFAAAWCWYLTFASDSRAGFLGALTAVGFILCGSFLGRTQRPVLRLVVLALVPIVLGGIVAVFPATTAGQRVLSTVTTSTEQPSTGRGTASARSAAWARVLHYDLADPKRALFGVGFGPDYMTDSGALELLVGRDASQVTRSPHNFILGAWSRLGLVGLLLLTAFVATFLRHIWRLRRETAEDPLLLLCALIPLALLPTMLFGVVFESPFGAIPFFYCAGVALACKSPRD